MRVLWVTNIPFGRLSGLSGHGEDTSGSWLNASLDAFIGNQEYEIVVATIGKTDKITTLVDGNITYCLLPGKSVSTYNYNSLTNRHVWEEIKKIYNPDLIQIWGTEFSHGYLALQVMQDTPAVIYMQGVMCQIARYYLAGMSDEELRYSITLRDIIKWAWIRQTQKNYFRQSLIEEKMIKKAGNVIVENQWCSTQCKAIAPNCVSYKSKLNIKEDFFNQHWDINQIEPFSVMANAARSPAKGLHILLKAFGIVVRKYPSAKLYVPAMRSPFEKTVVEAIKQNGYDKFIKKLIVDCGLRKNIHFLGLLSSKDMGHLMAKSNIFVMSSSIENHSSALIEAMIVGTPCIASYVGGVPEYVHHNKNGLLYRFEDYEVLASHIMALFDNPTLSVEIASEASRAMRKSRNTVDLKNELPAIYKKILAR